MSKIAPCLWFDGEAEVKLDIAALQRAYEGAEALPATGGRIAGPSLGPVTSHQR